MPNKIYPRGEWEAIEQKDGGETYHEVAVLVDAGLGNEQMVVVFDSLNRNHMIDPEEDAANMRMAAAARELLTALQNLLLVSENADETGYVDGEGWLPLEKIQEAAHAAITKATGEKFQRSNQPTPPMILLSEESLKYVLALAEAPDASPTLVAGLANELASTAAHAGTTLPDDLLARVAALQHRNSHDPAREASMIPPAPTSHVTDGVAS